MTKRKWWSQSVDETLTILKSSKSGLSCEDAANRKTNNSEMITNDQTMNPVRMFLNQFTDTMILVLLGATVVSGLVGAMIDAITIMIIVLINAVLGFVQEYKAEKSLEEIKKLAASYAEVIRSGERIQILAQELVDGDIVLVEAGTKVPADIRLIQSFSLEADESALTGESVPVEKDANLCCEVNTPLAEQANMVFMGTAINRGRGSGVVVATGMQTIMGEIAQMMIEIDRSMTPLQIKLDQLGKILIIICMVVCAAVAGMGIYRGEPVLTMFLAGISLAVAAIPEGLPAIVTVVLAVGIQRMAKRNAIVRKLPAVETLGCTTVICSDKTGTLTCNQMKVQRLASVDSILRMEQSEQNDRQQFIRKNDVVDPMKLPGIHRIIDISLHCNNASIKKQNRKIEFFGDPTEAALLLLASNTSLEKQGHLIKEIPFDSERKRMSVVIERNGEQYLFVKGALEVIIGTCSYVLKNERNDLMRTQERNYFMKLQEEWAAEALRILGFAFRKLEKGKWEHLTDKDLEKDLILTGMCGMIDPPRPGVKQSVKNCIDAGIFPIMITGDHPSTAAAIAKQIGISKEGGVITGLQIDQLNDKELYKRAVNDRVFARVSPQHKNRIVTVLKNKGHVVAMTGDGVNDAPAIKASDIGVAMGITGTQVTKEAASMILTDDDFSTIVEAVYEGRAIYDNIRKFIRYLLGCNIGEVLVMFVSSLFAMPLPLLPIQILWVNLVTDGLPAMALGLEPPEPGIMTRKPRPKNESIFARKMGVYIFSRGMYIAFISLAAFVIGMACVRMSGMSGLELPRTMAFTTLVMAQLFYVFECRSEKYSPFELGFFKNRFLIVAVTCSVIMQLCVLYLPFMQGAFKTVPLNGWQWGVILLLTGIRLLWKFILYTYQSLFVSGNNYVKIKP
ncbi:MAG: cation-translocating P-type ATPase [Bacillota bacterium]|nr:cation-translocating P-type ATPase [Bacillota bacterium]